MDDSDFLAGAAVPLAGRLPGALDQAGVGSEILNSGKTVNVVDLVEDREGKDFPDAVHGSQEMEGGGIVQSGRAEDIVFQGAEETIVMADEIEIEFDAAPDAGIDELLSYSLTVDFVGDVLAELGKIALAVSVLDVSEEIAARSSQVGAPAEKVPGSPHFGRVDVGLGNHPAPEEGGDLVGVDSIVLNLGTVNGFHVEGVTKDEGDLLLGAEIGEPVPCENSFDGDDDILSIRGHRPEELLRTSIQVTMDEGLARLIEDADVPGSGVEIDTAVVAVLLGIESHRGLLLSGWLPPPSILRSYAEEEASM